MNLKILYVLKDRMFLVTWMSLVIYIFYNTFEFYRHGRQFRYLRNILGLGLCISRGTASVLNICCALVLLPLCKKLNQILHITLSKLCLGLFFYWLENAKRFHMSVGITITILSVIHSGSHFVNIWNFWKYPDSDDRLNVLDGAGFTNNERLMTTLLLPVSTGILMLCITLSMSVSSLRMVRRNSYNIFWYIHQSYLLFLAMFLLHPLRGVLKEEINEVVDSTQKRWELFGNTTTGPVFLPIKSMTWTWMALPLLCFAVDLCWRFISRNRSILLLKKVEQYPGRVISLTMECENELFHCRAGQYILLQCQQISLLEWHPFTLVKVSNKKEFSVWIRVKGDWTEELERILFKNRRENRKISLLLDGPFFSPMEKLINVEVAICVAAGVGITPYVSILQSMFEDPRSKYPGRLHLIWIVRHEHEITWIEELLNKTMLKLINTNRPDRLHIEFYVTFKNDKRNPTDVVTTDHIINFNERNGLSHAVVNKYNNTDEERVSLLTPNMKRSFCDSSFITVKFMDNNTKYIDVNYRIAKKYSLLDCRLQRGRPKWDILFKHWVYLYPNYHLNLFCCGPKSLSTLLRRKCVEVTDNTTTKFTFTSEGFS